MSKKYLIATLLISISSIFLFFQFRQQKAIKYPKVFFFNVGQGDSAMIDDGNNIQILIDGGSGDVILEKLGEYMPPFDRKIELVIMTHPDKDHMGGLVEVLKYYQVNQILETGIICETSICKKWNKLINEKNIPVKYAKFGQKIKAKNMELDILYPFEKLKDKKVKDNNNTSIIFKLKINKDLSKLKNDSEKNTKIPKQFISYKIIDSYLFTGDAEFPVEKELLDKNINIKAKILKISHHGSKNATSNEFLKSVNPVKAIISVGKNSYGHPAEKLLNRLKNMNIEIFKTDKMGDLVFE